MSTKRVVGLGFCPLDEIIVVQNFPAIGTKASATLSTHYGGGSVATGLALLSTLGIQTQFISRIGNDTDGNFVLASLQQRGVDCSLVKQVEGEKTSRTTIIVDASDGKATIFIPKVSPVERLIYSMPNIIKEASILHLDGYFIEDAIQLATLAKEQSVLVSVNIGRRRQGIDKLLDLADILVTSKSFAFEESMCSSPEQAICYLVEKYSARNITITLQDKGAITWSKETGIIISDGISVHVIDDSSSGDIFHGAFLFGLLREWPLQKVLKFANATAAYSCQFYGGREGIPNSEDMIWDFLSDQPST